jgi:hypothetical protein
VKFNFSGWEGTVATVNGDGTVRVHFDNDKKALRTMSSALTLIEPEYEYVEVESFCLSPGPFSMEVVPMRRPLGSGEERLYRRIPKHVHDYKRVCSCGETE